MPIGEFTIHPYRGREERRANPRATRDIPCRRCAKRTKFDREFLNDPDGRWRHEEDGTLACVDPKTLQPYPEATVVDDDLCANGRPYPGGGMGPDFYRYDMSDDEWQ